MSDGANWQDSILTVCAPVQTVEGVQDVTVALPHLIGGRGIISTLWQPLTTIERSALKQSAEIIKNVIDNIQIA